MLLDKFFFVKFREVLYAKENLANLVIHGTGKKAGKWTLPKSTLLSIAFNGTIRTDQERQVADPQ